MVTFITILQVNLVMSILLYVMFLAYLYGISATLANNRQRPTQDPINTLIVKLLQADIVRARQRQDEGPPEAALPTAPSETEYPQRPTAKRPVADELLRQHKRYNSPRVLLSERPPLQPPPLYLTDDFVGSPEGGNRTRQKRYAEHKSYRGEFSVCESESRWVTDRTTAVDTHGHDVSVLTEIGMVWPGMKQYFYETSCKRSRPFKSGCQGIDDKHWNSQCKTSQTFVRALTQFDNMLRWRWIRINTACVCALSRKRRRT
ncbi:neurotrophin-3 [Salminus brasiliensis]|uniref:neurotrophin-3 n=1 Tax=Salminus brasiliensis TaxID=930266 RepID=UPI003B839CAD